MQAGWKLPPTLRHHPANHAIKRQVRPFESPASRYSISRSEVRIIGIGDLIIVILNQPRFSKTFHSLFFVAQLMIV